MRYASNLCRDGDNVTETHKNLDQPHPKLNFSSWEHTNQNYIPNSVLSELKATKDFKDFYAKSCGCVEACGPATCLNTHLYYDCTDAICVGKSGNPPYLQDSDC